MLRYAWEPTERSGMHRLRRADVHLSRSRLCEAGSSLIHILLQVAASVWVASLVRREVKLTNPCPYIYLKDPSLQRDDQMIGVKPCERSVLNLRPLP